MVPAAGMNVDTARMAALDGANDAKLDALRRPQAKKTDAAAVQKTAKDFETVFLEQMFNHMFSTIGSDKVTGGGLGEDTTRSMLVNAYAKSVTQAGGIGLAPAIANEIIKIQEKADGVSR
jgi:Rod binding domain-containing protein